MEAGPPILNLIFHGAVFGMGIAVFIGAALVWIIRRTRGLVVTSFWKIFVFGFFFYSVSEFSDLFTPSLRASLGMHNYFTELMLLIGLSLIFIALRRMILEIKEQEV